MMEGGLPSVLQRLAVLWAPRDVHESLLGDLEEEFALRRHQGPARARAWVLWQILSSMPSWIGFRVRRATRARRTLAPWMGVAAVFCCLAAFNAAPVLGAVRSAPEGWRLPLAVALNLSALVVGGWVAAQARGGRLRWEAWHIALLGLALPRLSDWIGAGSIPSMPSALWILAAVAAVAAGGRLGRPDEGGRLAG